MPVIFSEQDRAMIRENLFHSGYEFLKQYGYKRTYIEDIAKGAGIAKGTFYNFFTSKEQFFYELIIYHRDLHRLKMVDFFKAHTNVTSDEIAHFLTECYVHQENTYTYLTQEDISAIFRKLPKELHETKADSKEFAAHILSLLPNKSNTIDISMLVNLINILGMTTANKELQETDCFEATIYFLAKNIAAYLVETDK